LDSIFSILHIVDNVMQLAKLVMVQLRIIVRVVQLEKSYKDLLVRTHVIKASLITQMLKFAQLVQVDVQLVREPHQLNVLLV
jgi:hypothetical protein